MMHSLTWCARIWLWESAVWEFDGRHAGLAQFGFVDRQVVDTQALLVWLLGSKGNWRLQECCA